MLHPPAGVKMVMRCICIMMEHIPPLVLAGKVEDEELIVEVRGQGGGGGNVEDEALIDPVRGRRLKGWVDAEALVGMQSRGSVIVWGAEIVQWLSLRMGLCSIEGGDR